LDVNGNTVEHRHIGVYNVVHTAHRDANET
jgi:hypothetical protein